MSGFKDSTKMLSGHHHWDGTSVHRSTEAPGPQVFPGAGNRIQGNAGQTRANPPTQELSQLGGKSELTPGFRKGGPAKHFHVHKHFHAKGGKTRTVSHSYGVAEKHAETFAEGGHVHDETSPPAGGPDYKRGGRAKGGKWIQGAIKHPGALHKALHVPQGQKIPAKKLAQAAHSQNPTMRKRANLAKTLGKVRKNAGGALYATGGTINKLAMGGIPMSGTPAVGALGRMALRPQGLPMRAGPALRRPMPMPGPSPLARAEGGTVPSMERVAKRVVREHINYPAPQGHKGLGAALKRR